MNESKGHPGKAVRQRHIAFIRANWDLLAAAAYAGYLEDGRGMILLADEDFIDKPIGVFMKFRQFYMAEGNKIFVAAGNKWPGKKKEARWVSEYNPERCLLVAFSRTDGGVSSYRVEGVGSGIPELAYQRSKGSQN